MRERRSRTRRDSTLPAAPQLCRHAFGGRSHPFGSYGLWKEPILLPCLLQQSRGPSVSQRNHTLPRRFRLRIPRRAHSSEEPFGLPNLQNPSTPEEYDVCRCSLGSFIRLCSCLLCSLRSLFSLFSFFLSQWPIKHSFAFFVTLFCEFFVDVTPVDPFCYYLYFYRTPNPVYDSGRRTDGRATSAGDYTLFGYDHFARDLVEMR